MSDYHNISEQVVYFAEWLAECNLIKQSASELVCTYYGFEHDQDKWEKLKELYKVMHCMHLGIQKLGNGNYCHDCGATWAL